MNFSKFKIGDEVAVYPYGSVRIPVKGTICRFTKTLVCVMVNNMAGTAYERRYRTIDGSEIDGGTGSISEITPEKQAYWDDLEVCRKLKNFNMISVIGQGNPALSKEVFDFLTSKGLLSDDCK